MPMTMTKICGILKTRKTRSSSLCLVVRLKSTANDTDVVTRATKKLAPSTPWRVMLIVDPPILKVISESPGVTTLNKAGMAMKRENKGINIHVRFKKNPRLILEQSVSTKHNA